MASNDREYADYIVTILRADAGTWIERDTLYDVTVRLLALHLHDAHLLDGAMLATFTKRLVAAERAVGGPYKAATIDEEIMANAVIAQLFRALQAPLKNVELFIEAAAPTKRFILDNPEKTWPLVWPTKLPGVPMRADEFVRVASLPASLHSIISSPNVYTPQPPTSTLSSIATEVRSELQLLAPYLRSDAELIWRSITRADKRHEISRINHSFITSLREPLDSNIADVLDKANFYVWMAYSLYDDIIDQDSTGRELPFANTAHRVALKTYHSAAHSRSCNQRIDRCFDEMDAANAWELHNCRFTIKDDEIIIGTLPAYRLGRVLFKRAGAHTLGPLITLDSLPSLTAKKYRALDEGLVHYVIARQLSDDIHDFKSDFSRGQISYVVAYLLRKLHIKPGTYILRELIDQMSNYFWKKGVYEINELITRELRWSRECFERSGLLQTGSAFYDMTLKPLEVSVHASESVINNQKQFLESYAQKKL